MVSLLINAKIKNQISKLMSRFAGCSNSIGYADSLILHFAL